MDDQYKKIHFVGIRGSAMSGLSVIAKEAGFEVYGSDVPEEEATGMTTGVLLHNGIKFASGFDAKNLEWSPDLVVAGASWRDDNVEIVEAKKRGVPVMRHMEFVNMLSREKRLVAISGVHGKTTTTSLLVFLLRKLGADPSFMIGSGEVPGIGTNAHMGKDDVFVVEADEYKRTMDENVSKFLDIDPEVVVLTSIELDHVDMFSSVEEVKDAFAKLLEKKSLKFLAYNGDSESVAEVAGACSADSVSVGAQPTADLIIKNQKETSDGNAFDLAVGSEEITVTTNLPGSFSPYNISLCLAVLRYLGYSVKDAAQFVPEFQSANRRFQIHEYGDALLIDDYAHHPTAVRLTLEAARARYPEKNIICIYEPHQVSRTQHFKNEYRQAFDSCNEAIITDIYASKRENAEGFTAQDLVKIIDEHHPNVWYGGSIEEVARSIRERELGKDDVVVIMGAGRADLLVDKICSNK